MQVTVDDMLQSFGTTNLSQQCLAFYGEHDWRYELPNSAHRDEIILDVLKMLKGDTQIIGAPERTKAWDDGWQENLNAFLSTRSIEAIYPKFLRANKPIRFNQQFILPYNPFFEREFATLLIMWVASEFFSTCDSIYEFGCGSGFNVATIAKMYPTKYIHATDFSPSAVQLVSECAREFNWAHVHSSLFNMKQPDRKFEIKPNSAVLTCGAIEQLAGDFCSLIEYFCSQRPTVLVHIEPTIEFLDPQNLLDYLAIQFMQKRGYSRGLVGHLRELAASKQIEILKEKRLYFGNYRIEGYNCIVWRPL